MTEKTLRIGVMTVRGPDYHPTRRLIEAGQARGATVLPIHPYTAWPAFDNDQPVLRGNPAAQTLDAVMPRQGAEIKDACLPLIDHFERMGLPVINGRAAIERVRHKFFTLQALSAAGLPVPDTLFVSAVEGIAEGLAGFGPDGAVVKPVSGRQGTGIRHMRPGDVPDAAQVAELDRGRGLLIQRFIPPQGRQDLRLLVIGGNIAGAMGLMPTPGDFRANVHLGGTARPVDPPGSVAALALEATKAMDLEIAGVDIMIDADGSAYVSEVNYSPGFRGLEAATGRDIAGAMIDHVLGRIER